MKHFNPQEWMEKIGKGKAGKCIGICMDIPRKDQNDRFAEWQDLLKAFQEKCVCRPGRRTREGDTEQATGTCF
jgi:hypothetical protein